MLTGTYIKKTVIEDKEEVHPILMEIFKLRYQDNAWYSMHSVHFGENSIRSLEAIISTLTVMLPLTNLSVEEKETIISQGKNLLSQLKETEDLSIKIIKRAD